LAPLLAALGFGFKMGLLGWRWEALDSRYVGFWSYGVFTTVGALLAQTFYSVDVFLIGHLVGEKASAVAVYRVALLIPMATSVLPISVAATDFVKNAHQKDNPKALRAYMRGYWKTFGLLSFAALGVLWCFSPWLLTVFGASYAEGATVMRVFLLGSLGAHWLRVPYGHLLSAVGRADLNTYVNGAVLAATIPLCWWAIPVWGIVGAAGAMATMLWVSGGLYALVFELHLRRQSQV
jgi:O-antigen/teichoic acid export membrane protein